MGKTQVEIKKNHNRYDEKQYFCVGSNVLEDRTEVKRIIDYKPVEKDTCTPNCVQLNFRQHEQYHEELNYKYEKFYNHEKCRQN